MNFVECLYEWFIIYSSFLLVLYTIHAVSRYLHSKFSIFVGTCKLLIGWYITMPKVKQKVRHVERHDRWKSLPRSTRGALWVSAKFDRRELKVRRVWSASWGNVNAELDNPRAESDPRGGSAPRAGGTCKRGNCLYPIFRPQRDHSQDKVESPKSVLSTESGISLGLTSTFNLGLFA